MFGNIKGWIISVVLIVIVYFAAFHSHLFPKGSSPSAHIQQTSMLEVRNITEPISLIVGQAPTGAGNAADDYQQAIAAFDTHEMAIARFKEDWDRKERELKAEGKSIQSQVADLDGTERKAESDRLYDEYMATYEIKFPDVMDQFEKFIAAGAAKKEMRYLEKYGDSSGSIHIETEQAMRLSQITYLFAYRARYQMLKGEPEKAIESLNNLVVMGWQMYNEHADVATMRQGLNVQIVALDRLEKIYKEQDNKIALANVKKYTAHINSIDTWLKEKYGVVWFSRALDAKPGDVYYIIEFDQDPAWRRRAVMTLGVLKFMDIPPGDRILVRRKILKYCKSSDPMIRAAAEAARDTTLKEYKTLGRSRFPG